MVIYMLSYETQAIVCLSAKFKYKKNYPNTGCFHYELRVVTLDVAADFSVSCRKPRVLKQVL
jgi:hypothetical protein